ncbi:hypothetical protein LIS66_27385 (plasmid) [Pseudomonas sp. HN2]|uniref:hypothetical protein n=1 Tax=Pseudomonas sp. HN2 TaxID=2884805 RepID=UPI001D14F30F|nr:hypothetical protein [Pseudomonas sp. HN2]UEB98756.1 hypothetical protein LIS66_27385 [Pseudomonas sp. HN2]
MSNAIIGIALPASVVDVVRWMLEDLSRAPSELAVAYKLGELQGAVMTLERLQRLSRANAGRLCQHANGVAKQREVALQEKPQ